MKMTLFLILCLFLTAPLAASAASISCQLSKDEIEVGLNPTKEKITVFGQIPEGLPVIVRVEGPMRPVLVSLSQNHSFVKCSEAEVLGLPGFYQVLTSQSVKNIPMQYWDTLGVNPDYRQLKEKAWTRMRQNLGESYEKYQQDYLSLALKIKDQEQMLALRQGVVQRKGQQFWVDIPLLAGMPLGEIKVTALTVMDNKVVAAPTQVLQIRPASLLSLGSQELSVSAVMVISLFMLPILLLTVAQILEMVEQYKEEEKRTRLLKQLRQP